MLSSVTRVALRSSSSRLTSIRFYSEGATGAPRSGGEKSGDSFTKREKAQEDLYVRQVEAQKLKALREALKKQREHLDDIEAHLDELEKK
ncbi:mitochondrial ATPase inhibitor, IATP-domain-containing protein [Lipomyces chichibuensis]|uniref:mitochondrial ATPase inhibitor, IATP-domain-containing protein n=1 Tax=Lipomyces chichibuensis TaxID=1546026 RepID=UPI00334426BE